MKTSCLYAGCHTITVDELTFTAQRLTPMRASDPVSWELTLEESDEVVAWLGSLRECKETAAAYAGALAQGWSVRVARVSVCGIVYRCTYLEREGCEISQDVFGAWHRRYSGARSASLEQLLEEVTP